MKESWGKNGGDLEDNQGTAEGEMEDSWTAGVEVKEIWSRTEGEME